MTPAKVSFLSPLLRNTWKGTAEAAVDQRGCGKTAQQPRGEDRNFPSTPPFPGTRYWGPGRASPACRQQLPGAAGRVPALCPTSGLFSVVPSFPPRRPRTATSSSLFSSSLVPSARRREWPAAADPAQALPLPQPSEHTMGPEAGLQHSSDDAGGSPGDSQLPPWPSTPLPNTRKAIATNGRRL